jgi:branched-chain amino acid transport system substrate-binding protein
VSRSRTVLAAAVVLVAGTVLAGCSGADLPMPTPTPSPTYAVTGDGVLRIGTLFAQSGAGAYLGRGQVAGVEAAVREINEAGGVNGVPVEVFHRNAGDTTTDTAEASYTALVEKGVDVVIGPSSALVQQLAPAVVEAGVPMVSPSATLPLMTALDDNGLIFRTIGDYSDQGSVIASALAQAGAKKVAYIYLNDANGSALLDSLTTAVDAEGLTLAYSGSYKASSTAFSSIITKTKAAKPDAVVLSAAADAVEQTTALISALTAASLGGEKLWLTSLAFGDYSQLLPAGTLDLANGVLEAARPDAAFTARLVQADPAVTSTRFAAEAYDATMLVALAAIRAGDDGGAAIARLLPTVSSAGIPCTSFGACLDVLRTEPEIDYDGISGPVDLSADGDVAAGSWTIYVSTAGNVFTPVRTVISG